MFTLEEEKRAVYKSGKGTRAQGHRDACVGTWDLGLGHARRGTWGKSSMGRGDVWDGDAGTSNTGTQGTRDVNHYCKSRR